MKVIKFDATVPRFALGKVLGKVTRSVLWNGLSATYEDDIPVPSLPGPDWVQIKTRYGGICGSDLSLINLKAGHYLSPFISFPFTFGHENVGWIEEIGSEVSDWKVNERVVAEPALWCRPRGFDQLCEFCARGEINRCERFAEGTICPGVQIGNCRDTGGSWSSYFLAHQSQLYRVPDGLSDENALMVEPFAIGLHAVLQNYPADDQTVLIIGAGTIGLVILAALRALGSTAHIIVKARYPFQGEVAKKLGADEVISSSREDGELEVLARQTDSRLLRPVINKSLITVLKMYNFLRAGRLPKDFRDERILIGNADVTYECVGTESALDDAFYLTKADGKVVLIGDLTIARGPDFTALWAKELNVTASFLYHHAERYQGKTWKTFDLALDLMANQGVDLGWMVTHKFPLEEYGKAFKMVGNRRVTKMVKGVFDFS